MVVRRETRQNKREREREREKKEWRERGRERISSHILLLAESVNNRDEADMQLASL